MKKKFARRVMWSSLVLAGVFSSLTSKAEVLLEEHLEIVVTATKVEQNLQNVPASVSVVTEEEIARHAYSSVADMLQDVPGVEVADNSLAGAMRIRIRGESGARVLVLVDGQKINEQKSMSGAPLLIDPASIARIEVVKGPASVLYGSEAIGGVVNIITKKGGNKPIGGSASLTYNSATSSFEESLAISGAKDGYYYRLGGTYSDQSDRKTPSGTLEGSDYLVRAVNGTFGFEDKKIAWGVSFEDYYSEADVPATPNFMGPGSNFDLNLPEWSREKLGGFVDIKNVSDDIAKIHFDAYAQKTIKDFEQDMFTPTMNSNMSLNTFNDQKTYALHSQIDFTPNDDHYVIAGLSISRDTLDATSDATGSGIFAANNYSYFYDASINTYALYVQDQWTLPDDFELTLGARQTWVESELSDTDNSNTPTDKVNDSHPVFSAGLTWSGAKDLTLRGLFSQGYRFPALSQLFIGTAHGGSGMTYANPDLEAETSNNIEIGARYNTDAWTIDVAAFANHAKDYITTTAIDAVPNYQYVNVDEAKTYGVEAAISYKIAQYNLTPYISATYMRRKYEVEDGSSTWKTNTPNLLGRLGVKYERGLEGSGTMWADLYLRAATDADEEASDGTITSHEAWQTVNLGVGTNFGSKQQYKVSLNINNIFDHSYSTAQNSLEEAGRHVVARLSASF